MNRPTIDVDELLSMADEALDAADYQQAVAILRKAVAAAPLRRDIRNRLAIALEGAPVSKTISRRQKSVTFVDDELNPSDRFSTEEDSPESVHLDDDGNGREAIGQIARKAFEAAAGQTTRAGIATRNLTNLLQQGIQTWKSSMSEVTTAPDVAARVSEVKGEADSDVSGATRSRVFRPEQDLNEYLKRASTSQTGLHHVETIADDDEDLDESTERVVRTAPTSKKSAKSAVSQKKAKRPNDVEDVLAAGIGGFIDAIGHADKTKIFYGIVYVAMAGLFGFACLDVAKKFPGVEAIPGRQIQSAGLGILNLSETAGKDEAISKARSLVAAGKSSEAISLLSSELESGRLLKNRDLIRIELAALLNGVAEQHLRTNDFSESVETYKKALKVLPADGALQLRLANALYYQGSLSSAEMAKKQSALADASGILENLTAKEINNLQAHRLLALVQEAQGKSDNAKDSWGKVKTLADANSAEYKEAESHLK